MKPMYVDLQGKVALVTGGGTGIGRAISIGLARCGAGTIVNYSRSKDASEETVAQIEKNGGKALAIKADVTDEKQFRYISMGLEKIFIFLFNFTFNLHLKHWKKIVGCAKFTFYGITLRISNTQQ